jgi:hypothetical protein
MTFNLKTVLLAGTALVAVGFAAPHAAFAADELSCRWQTPAERFTATGPDETCQHRPLTGRRNGNGTGAAADGCCCPGPVRVE